MQWTFIIYVPSTTHTIPFSHTHTQWPLGSLGGCSTKHVLMQLYLAPPYPQTYFSHNLLQITWWQFHSSSCLSQKNLVTHDSPFLNIQPIPGNAVCYLQNKPEFSHFHCFHYYLPDLCLIILHPDYCICLSPCFPHAYYSPSEQLEWCFSNRSQVTAFLCPWSWSDSSLYSELEFLPWPPRWPCPHPQLITSLTSSPIQFLFSACLSATKGISHCYKHLEYPNSHNTKFSAFVTF